MIIRLRESLEVEAGIVTQSRHVSMMNHRLILHLFLKQGVNQSLKLILSHSVLILSQNLFQFVLPQRPDLSQLFLG